MVVGAHEKIGCWNPSRALVLSTDAILFPVWHTGEIELSEPVTIEYKFIIKRANGSVEWEGFPTNRTAELRANTVSHIQNVWGSLATASITCFPLRTEPDYPSDPPGGGGVDGVAGVEDPRGVRTAHDAVDVLLQKPSNDFKSIPDVGSSTIQSQGIRAAAAAAAAAAATATGAGAADASGSASQPPTPYSEMLSALPSPHVASVRTEAADEAGGSGVVRAPLRRSAFILANTGPISDYYVVDRTIGRGTWGEVKLVIDRQTKARRAAKKIPKCYIEDVDRFRQEIEIMKCLDHPNIVRLFETFEDLTDFYLVMEYCSGGELFDRLIDSGVLTEGVACTIMKQILAAVAYCHMHRVAHRDLKPENFLFLTDQPNSPMKLIDFGLAARFKPGTPMRTRAGTPYYVSPQVSKTISIHAYRHPRTRISAEQAIRHQWFNMHMPDSISTEPLGIDILSKFRRFQSLSRLKKLALTVIAQHLDDSEIESLKAVFTQLDTRGDGVLSIDEVREGIARSGVRLPSDMVLEEVLTEVDTAGTGTIDYTEFIAACLHQSHYIREEACRAAFRVLDINGDGHVSAEELKQVFHMAGDLETDAAAELHEADADGDGMINFEEFCGLMRKVPSLALVTEHTVSMMRKTCSRTNVSEMACKN
ncbi:hypothetical protein ACSSS7_007235 [Eimeria intestinalis]